MGAHFGIGFYAGIAVLIVIAVLALTGHCNFAVGTDIGVR